MKVTVCEISVASKPECAFYLKLEWAKDLGAGFVVQLCDGVSAWSGEGILFYPLYLNIISFLTSSTCIHNFVCCHQYQRRMSAGRPRKWRWQERDMFMTCSWFWLERDRQARTTVFIWHLSKPEALSYSCLMRKSRVTCRWVTYSGLLILCFFFSFGIRVEFMLLSVYHLLLFGALYSPIARRALQSLNL